MVLGQLSGAHPLAQAWGEAALLRVRRCRTASAPHTGARGPPVPQAGAGAVRCEGRSVAARQGPLQTLGSVRNGAAPPGCFDRRQKPAWATCSERGRRGRGGHGPAPPGAGRGSAALQAARGLLWPSRLRAGSICR